MNAFVLGAKRCFPLALTAVPFALVMTTAAAVAGVDAVDTVLMSLVVFAGASQLVAIELIRQGAPMALILATALLVNLRLMMYSAALAPKLAGLPRWKRALLAFLITDQAFALFAAYAEEEQALEHRVKFFLGAALTLFAAWQLGTWVGVAVGETLPADWSLDFMVALAFIALAAPAVRDRPKAMAAGASLVVYSFGASLPYGLGLLPAAAAGVAAGVWAEGRR